MGETVDAIPVALFAHRFMWVPKRKLKILYDIPLGFAKRHVKYFEIKTNYFDNSKIFGYKNAVFNASQTQPSGVIRWHATDSSLEKTHVFSRSDNDPKH